MTDSNPNDIAGVKQWFLTLATHVREVDYIGARPIFAPDMIAFGTFTDFMTGQAEAETAQWRSVWENIDGFTWRPDIRVIVSPDRKQAVGMGIFDSTGYRRTARRMIGPGERRWCSCVTVSMGRGWRSTRICRCSGMFRHSRSRGSRRSC